MTLTYRSFDLANRSKGYGGRFTFVKMRVSLCAYRTAAAPGENASRRGPTPYGGWVSGVPDGGGGARCPGAALPAGLSPVRVDLLEWTAPDLLEIPVRQ